MLRILRKEPLELQQLGVEIVQFDEPVLTELVFAGKAAKRTFMCAALAATDDQAAELELAVELINRVVDGTMTAVHACGGNWSRQQDVLLSGDYAPLLPSLARMEALAELLGPDRIWLNPDCGFGTFAERPVATPEDAMQKLRILAEAAASLRAGS